jgi:hypothetical protein
MELTFQVAMRMTDQERKLGVAGAILAVFDRAGWGKRMPDVRPMVTEFL